MKILFIHNQYQYAGGEDIAVEAELKLLNERGHDTQLLKFDNKNIDKPKKSFLTGLQSIYKTSSGRLVKNAIDVFKPDIIHVHNLFFLASPSVLFAAKSRKVPLIFTLHNYRLICCNALLLRNNAICELCIQKKMPLAGIKYKCYRSSGLQSALVTSITGIHKLIQTWKHKVHTYIALTEFGKNKFLNSSLDLQSEQIKVIPNFVEDTGVGTSIRAGFLFVGRISMEKGVEMMLECFAKLPKYNLIVAGDGPDKIKLQTRFNNFSNIIFYGQKPKHEIMILMKQSEALVFPSIWYEGLPFTIIEAFSTGTPVIASNLGAMSDMIKDGYNGLHFNPNDVHDLNESIEKFMQITDRDIMRVQARETYEKFYTPDYHYHLLLSVYQKALDDSNKQ
jgi:glycosyltransferase involved in cell wall biosynthesis